MEINIAMARLFKQQCIGTYSGHMASIPHNPILQSIFVAISGDTYQAEQDFADTLIALGNALKKEDF